MTAPKNRRLSRSAKVGVEPLEGRLVLDASSAAFITNVFEGVLHRDPTAAEISSWSSKIKAGTTVTAFATALVQSPERRGLEVDNAFESVFHRHADAASKATYVNSLAHGQTDDDVTRALLESPEYQKSHASNTSFVQGLFQDVLGRPATAKELHDDVTALSGGGSRDSLVRSVLRSGEREGEVVDRAFDDVLQHVGTKAERDQDVNDLSSGRLHNDDVLIRVIASPENEQEHGGRGGRGGRGGGDG
jgi:hypothetical protein